MDLERRKIFAEKIKVQRKKKRLTQEEIAVQLGIKKTTYSNWERGIRAPENHETFRQLAQLFGVTADYLMATNDEDDFLRDIEMDDADALITKYNLLLDNKPITHVQAKMVVKMIRSFIEHDRQMAKQNELGISLGRQ